MKMKTEGKAAGVQGQDQNPCLLCLLRRLAGHEGMKNDYARHLHMLRHGLRHGQTGNETKREEGELVVGEGKQPRPDGKHCRHI